MTGVLVPKLGVMTALLNSVKHTFREESYSTKGYSKIKRSVQNSDRRPTFQRNGPDNITITLHAC